MEHILVNTDNSTVYPYSVSRRKIDNPRTSFPKAITNATLEAFGVYPVSHGAEPNYDPVREKLILNVEPILSNGKWVNPWVVAPRFVEFERDGETVTVDQQIEEYSERQSLRLNEETA